MSKFKPIEIELSSSDDDIVDDKKKNDDKFDINANNELYLKIRQDSELWSSQYLERRNGLIENSIYTNLKNFRKKLKKLLKNISTNDNIEGNIPADIEYFKETVVRKIVCNNRYKGPDDKEIHDLGFTEPLPRYSSYTTLRASMPKEDDRLLRHVPYFGENTKHRIDLQDYDLDNSLKNEEVYLEEDDEVIMKAVDKYGENENTFEIVASILQLTTKAVNKRFKELSNVAEKLTKQQKMALKKYGYDQVDTNTTNVWDTYDTLFCGRCLVFDCQLHGTMQPRARERLIPSDTLQTRSSNRSLAPVLPFEVKKSNVNESCGDECWMNTITKSKRRKITWTVFHERLIKRLCFMYGNNICNIAKLISDLGCIDVYNYVCRNLEKLKVLNEIETPKDRLAKMSKVKLSGGFSAKRLQYSKEHISHPYTPCDHDGPCSPETDCICYANFNFCEVTCRCGPECTIRFTGCRCRAACHTRGCPCFAACRECDPTFCICDHECVNREITDRVQKPVILGRSMIHGWGAFAREAADKGALITEYVGELISQEEADRRGKIYDKFNRSYLFNLTTDNCVDAARKGNKIKFANHSDTPNCLARIVSVKGDQRIGLYAHRKIKAGEELFFDYQHERFGNEPQWYDDKNISDSDVTSDDDSTNNKSNEHKHNGNGSSSSSSSLKLK